MKVLIACEESQTITKAFRDLGHEAYSCDLQPCSGLYPEYHLQQDVTPLLQQKWDLIIAHPPCTYLSHAGARWLYPNKVLNQDRYLKGLEGKKFFMQFFNANSERICIENPVPSSIYNLPPCDQIIQPWQFGDEAQKKTLLWLKGLPKLIPTKIVGKGEMITYKSGKKKAKWFMDAAKASTSQERAKLRSKTFEGVAKAMAEQWSV